MIKNKVSYVNSDLPEFWYKTESCYTFNPWIKKEHFKKLQAHYKKIESSDFQNTTATLEEDFDFVKLKFEMYSHLLAKRLNSIHNINYSDFYWEKVLSTGFLRTITFLYDAFKKLESSFDIKIHGFKYLSKECFFTPNHFEDLRGFLSKNDYSNEQLFSIYINTFFDPDKKVEIKTPIRKELYFQRNLWIQSLKRKLYVTKKRFLKKSKSKNIKTAILGSYFSKEKKSYLTFKSRGKIDEFHSFWKLEFSKKLSSKKRAIISKKNNDFDRFDTFFFNALYSLFPNYLLESFDYNHKKVLKELKEYPQLKMIISENWISHCKNRLLLATAKECYNIKLVTNEHNCFFHIYEGNYTNFLIELSDLFLTLGWKPTQKNAIRGGSLFPFELETSTYEIDVLFVAGALLYKKPIFSSIYNIGGETAIKTIEFNNAFFNHLSNDSIAKIHYLGYPIHKISNLGIIPKETFYDFDFSILKKVKGKAKVLMPKSRLVIIDYVATSYIEALVSNIPTVVFFDQVNKPLNRENKDFFTTLINAKIFHTNPESAASHVNQIINEPEKWWYSQQVQQVKDDFLKKNLDTKTLTQIILEKNNEG